MSMRLPIHPAYLPQGVSVLDNGILDSDLLFDVHAGCCLFKVAASAWQKMVQAASEEGVELKPANAASGYRSLEVQESLFNASHVIVKEDVTGIYHDGHYWMRRKGRPQVAVPGSSLHGYGLALQLADRSASGPARQWLMKHALAYGWCWFSSQSPRTLVYCGPRSGIRSTRKVYDAREMAEIVAGTWVRPPAEGATFDRLSTSSTAYRPRHSLLVLRSKKEAHSPGTLVTRVRHRLPDWPSVPLLTDRDVLPEGLKNPVLRVESLLGSVEQWLRVIRSHHGSRIFMVTGSAGKTSTTTLLSSVLSTQGSCLTSIQLNMPGGVYAAALRMRGQDFVVLETAQGALPRTAQTLSPDVALLVSVSPAHMDKHESLEAMTRKKASIFFADRPGLTAVINRDIPHYDVAHEIAVRHGRRILTYGKTAGCDFTLLACEPFSFEFEYLGRRFQAGKSTPGEHVAMNALAVLASLEGIGLDWRRQLAKLPSFDKIPLGRGDLTTVSLPGERRVTVLNHAYNANPGSMAVALQMLRDYPAGTGRRIAVLADMREMGPDAPALHASLSVPVMDAGLDMLLVVGEDIRQLRQQLPESYPWMEFSTVGLLFESLPGLLRDGDVVMFKGSNGTGLFRELNDFLGSATVASDA